MPTGVRTRRAAAAAAAASAHEHNDSLTELPVVRARQGRTSRAGVGMRIRRQQHGADDGAVGRGVIHSSSTEDFTLLQAKRAEPHVVEDEDDQPPSSDGNEEEAEEEEDDHHSAAGSSVSLSDGEYVTDSGLRRSSFNSGYYARFFVEERKLGSGGVGSVYLTHHVLDGVALGTYAVKKIPVGNSRPWLVQALKEVRALEGLHHRHIIAYKHSWLEERYKPSDFGPSVPCLFLLMEYANRGTLADLIWPKNAAAAAAANGTSSSAGAAAARRAHPSSIPVPHVIPEEDVWWLFIGTCLGLRHLHRAGVIHVRHR
jgi:hypothetical protein